MSYFPCRVSAFGLDFLLLSLCSLLHNAPTFLPCIRSILYKLTRYFAGTPTTRFRGEPHFDGGFTNFLPKVPGLFHIYLIEGLCLRASLFAVASLGLCSTFAHLAIILEASSKCDFRLTGRASLDLPCVLCLLQAWKIVLACAASPQPSLGWWQTERK